MKRKKAVKMRGSRTHGYGSHKKHRGAGSRGGRGFAGSTKHMKLWVKKYHPEKLIKRRFKSLVQKGRRPPTMGINLADIVLFAEKSNTREINLTDLGYDKVLGTGTITSPLIITAHAFSKKAAEKIEQAGGKAVIT